MQKYRKRPIEVEAIQLTPDNQAEIIELVNEADGDAEQSGAEIILEAAYSSMMVTIGDWVIKGVEGEFYCCADSVFKQSYDAVICSADCEPSTAEDEAVLKDVMTEMGLGEEYAMGMDDIGDK